MRQRTRPTIKDIAAASGVSFQAVSVALRDKPGISEKRRHQIKRLAEELGYYPQASGRLLRAKNTRRIGAIVARSPGDIAFEGWTGLLLDRFVENCERDRRAYHIEFHHHAEDDAGFVPPDAVAGGLVDGVILAGDVGQPLRDWLARRGVPFVSINEPAEHCVIADDGAGMRQAMRYLHAQGHRRIAAAFSSQRYISQRLRLEAFTSTADELGLQIPDFKAFAPVFERADGADDADVVLTWASDLLSRADRPTAIIGASVHVLCAAMNLGLRVPEDLSLVAWLLPAQARSVWPALTLSVIHTDFRKVMQQAMVLLDELLAGRTPESPRRVVPAELFVAGSTAPAPTAVAGSSTSAKDATNRSA
jgi:DNA-binding LacI/PurR family transcriptional regulator